MAKRSEFARALEESLRTGRNLNRVLRKYQDHGPLTAASDARAVAKVLTHLVKTWPEQRAVQEEALVGGSALHQLAAYFQSVESKKAAEVLRDEGHPQLIRLFDLEYEMDDHHADELMFLLKIFAMYGQEDGAQRIIQAAHDSFESTNFMWSVVFREMAAEGHPCRFLVAEALSEPLPKGFIAVTFLDFINELAVRGEIREHPFDTSAGRKLLRGWLMSNRCDEYSYALSATTSLPFIATPHRNRLLALAMDHADAKVQLEAAWASAKLGSTAGLKMLARMCLDPNHSTTACAYLEEINQSEAIPPQAKDPNFQAMAEMCDWLAHPQEYGRSPDHIELYDTRVIFWPPTDDRRRLWLFKYVYQAPEPGQPDEVGIGMVGSVTFALFGETKADLPPEDVYALHCCWELEVNNDPRAPRKRSVAAGKKILARYQKS
jgi:hypothetical protein